MVAWMWIAVVGVNVILELNGFFYDSNLHWYLCLGLTSELIWLDGSHFNTKTWRRGEVKGITLDSFKSFFTQANWISVHRHKVSFNHAIVIFGVPQGFRLGSLVSRYHFRLWQQKMKRPAWICAWILKVWSHYWSYLKLLNSLSFFQFALDLKHSTVMSISIFGG